MLIKLASRHRYLSLAIADQALISAVNFAIGIILARTMGPYEFGRFTLTWMVIVFVTNIQHALIISPMMSIGPKQDAAEAQVYYGAAVAQQLCYSVGVFTIIMIGTLVAGAVYPPLNVQNLSFALATAATTHVLQEFVRRYLFVRGYALLALVNDCVRYGGQLCIILILLHNQEVRIQQVLLAISISAAGAASLGMLPRAGIAFSKSIFWMKANQHWAFSKWLLGSALAQWASSNLFMLAAGVLLSAAAVGALKAAQNILGVLHILFLGLDNVVPSQAAQRYEGGGQPALLAYIRKVVLFGGIATALPVAAASLFPEFWLQLLYGAEYAGYGSLLRWYGIIYLIVFLATPLSAALRALEYTRPIFLSGLAAAVISGGAIYPLITTFGLNGVIMGILLVTIIRQIILAHAVALAFGQHRSPLATVNHDVDRKVRP